MLSEPMPPDMGSDYWTAPWWSEVPARQSSTRAECGENYLRLNGAHKVQYCDLNLTARQARSSCTRRSRSETHSLENGEWKHDTRASRAK